MTEPAVEHGIFMLNHVLPQLVVAAFTQNFYFGSFAQVLVNFAIFNVLLPPRPLPFELLLELNVIFVIAQWFGALLGIAIARAAFLPTILEVSLPWESLHYAWSFYAWLRAALCVILLTLPSGIVYDFGVSVWIPEEFALWGLIATLILVLLYPVVYFILQWDIGRERSFTSREQMQRFLALLFTVQVFFINVWWSFNTLFQAATQLAWVMLGLLVTGFGAMLLVYLYRWSVAPDVTRAEIRHRFVNYYTTRC